ncbi:MAG TPA: hypothetical protein VMK12_20870 [Anaeromyxobacteraceae bacterium]|nr:hypothetical protein [Anaeromyxobacteraceae bacterium]
MKTIIRAIVIAAIPFGAIAQQPPEQQGPHHHHGPSPEAIAACQGKDAGAPCSFSHHDRTVQGTCFTPSSDKPLACRPPKPPAGAPKPQ